MIPETDPGWFVRQSPASTAPASAAPATPRQRRVEAMAMLCELYFPASHDYRFTDCPPAEIAGNIRKLAALGRAPAWRAQIERWARLVEDHPDATHWAFFQGSVWAGGAA